MWKKFLNPASGGGTNYSKITQKLTHSASGTTESTSTTSYTPTKDEDAIVITILLGTSSYTSYAYLKEGNTKVVTLSQGSSPSPNGFVYGSTSYATVFQYYKLQAGATYKLAIKNGNAQNNSTVRLYVLE